MARRRGHNSLIGFVPSSNLTSTGLGQVEGPGRTKYKKYKRGRSKKQKSTNPSPANNIPDVLKGVVASNAKESNQPEDTVINTFGERFPNKPPPPNPRRREAASFFL